MKKKLIFYIFSLVNIFLIFSVQAASPLLQASPVGSPVLTPRPPELFVPARSNSPLRQRHQRSLSRSMIMHLPPVDLTQTAQSSVPERRLNEPQRSFSISTIQSAPTQKIKHKRIASSGTFRAACPAPASFRPADDFNESSSSDDDSPQSEPLQTLSRELSVKKKRPALQMFVPKDRADEEEKKQSSHDSVPTVSVVVHAPPAASAQAAPSTLAAQATQNDVVQAAVACSALHDICKRNVGAIVAIVLLCGGAVAVGHYA